jgi:histidinol-phosphate aminotransferase
VTVPMKDFTHDLPAMLAAIRPDTRIVYISNPNNPTGTVVSRASLEDFMARVPDHVMVCIDEAYIELLPPADQPDTLRYVKESRNVVILRTFSKLYGLAGLRLGYAVASPECIQLINRVRQPFNVNAMAMVAAIAALKDDKFVERTRRLVKSGLAFYKREFNRMGLKFVPSCANFVLVETGAGRQVFQEMQKGGVIVRPMDGYGLPDHVRITIGKPAENRRCIEVLQKVLAGRKQGSI